MCSMEWSYLREILMNRLRPAVSGLIGKSARPPQLVASFILNETRDVRFSTFHSWCPRNILSAIEPPSLRFSEGLPHNSLKALTCSLSDMQRPDLRRAASFHKRLLSQSYRHLLRLSDCLPKFGASLRPLPVRMHTSRLSCPHGLACSRAGAPLPV